ncbi:MAG: 16S rRNA (adenine(1518)-N(6)/adenine(1519)-N(6))-dimethyltransferase RsmA [Candidatus Anstonellaceae archaeon]
MGARLGQHFIIDEEVLELEAQLADVSGKSVLEIGAGDGRLTQKLLSLGAKKITAVELDPKLCSLLKKKFSSKVNVVQADFLSLQPGYFDRIVGNIPYYITSPILVRLAEYDFELALLCMQKEVALRLVSPPGSRNYGRLSVFCQLAFKPQLVCQVSKQALYPVPKVDSCIVTLTKTGFVPSKEVQNKIAAIFSHKKKSLKNAVIDGRDTLFGRNDKKKARAVAQTLKYAKRKVFTLSPSEVLETIKEMGCTDEK